MLTPESPSENGYESPTSPSEDQQDFEEERSEEDVVDSVGPLKTDAHASPNKSVPRRRRASESCMPRRISRVEMSIPMPYSGKTFRVNSMNMC